MISRVFECVECGNLETRAARGTIECLGCGGRMYPMEVQQDEAANAAGEAGEG